ncbi:MAG: hypothetical protein WD801_05545, partial [Gemmatimonadaceae bacterium]
LERGYGVGARHARKVATGARARVTIWPQGAPSQRVGVGRVGAGCPRRMPGSHPPPPPPDRNECPAPS